MNMPWIFSICVSILFFGLTIDNYVTGLELNGSSCPARRGTEFNFVIKLS